MYLPNPHVYFPRHHPVVEDPISKHFHYCIFCVRIYLLLFLSNWLNFWFWPLIVYIQIVIWYVYAFCGIWVSLLLRSIENCLRLIFPFSLWPRLWASPLGPCHLRSGQTKMSVIYMSYYCHCTNCSFWWRASMPTDNNKTNTSTLWVGQFLVFIQCSYFISVAGQLAALLDEKTLVCLNSPSMLGGH